MVQGRFACIATAETLLRIVRPLPAARVTLGVSSIPDRALLRRELRQRRRDLPAATRIAAAEALADRLLALHFLPSSGHVGGYWAMDGEIGLHAFQLRLPPALTYCLPLLHADDTLRFAPWRPGAALVTNRFGIPEPDVDPDRALPASEMALLVLPLVGFDADCARLGMGGGWYDRSLAFRHLCAAPPWLVGAGFAVQQVAALPLQPWDVRLDAVCSEAATHLAEETA